jgi:hypothetical protein
MLNMFCLNPWVNALDLVGENGRPSLLNLSAARFLIRLTKQMKNNNIVVIIIEDFANRRRGAAGERGLTDEDGRF